MRGRKPVPDAIKELKGNPGKRRLHLDSAPPAAPPAAAGEPETVHGTEVPDWLTHPRERAFFLAVVDDFTRRAIVKAVDHYVVGRWAHGMHQWVENKIARGSQPPVYRVQSPHGTYIRRNPIDDAQRMLNRELMALEDRIGLSPASRQAIIANITRLPATGDFFGTPAQEQAEEQTEDELTEHISPLDYLDHGGRLN